MFEVATSLGSLTNNKDVIQLTLLVKSISTVTIVRMLSVFGIMLKIQNQASAFIREDVTKDIHDYGANSAVLLAQLSDSKRKYYESIVAGTEVGNCKEYMKNINDPEVIINNRPNGFPYYELNTFSGNFTVLVNKLRQVRDTWIEEFKTSTYAKVQASIGQIIAIVVVWTFCLVVSLFMACCTLLL